VVNVRRRASSRRGDSLEDETGSARLRARYQERHFDSRPAIHGAGSGEHTLDLILIRHGSDFFHGFYALRFTLLTCLDAVLVFTN
jgi:hypothetical protein